MRRDQLAHGLELFRQGLGPGTLAGAGLDRIDGLGLDGRGVAVGAAAVRVLEPGRSQRTRPRASSAARSAFSATSRVSNSSSAAACSSGLVRQRCGAAGLADQGRDQVGPAVGPEHGGVEFVVELGEDGDQALIVDLPFLCRERRLRALRRRRRDAAQALQQL